MPYDINKFRTVKHGLDEVSAHCRHCDFHSQNAESASKHAKKTLHTVDVYRTHHVEYTSHVKGAVNECAFKGNS